MSNAAVIALVLGALLTVVTITVVVSIAASRIGRAIADATRATEKLTSASAALSDHQQVTQRELDRLSRSVDTLRSSREHR